MKGLEGVVDDFLPRILGDPRVMGNPVVAAKLEEADPALVRQRFLDLLCQETGGPCRYTGRDMKTAHRGLGITKAEWDAGGQDFLAALVAKNVAEREKAELMALIGASEKDIVEKP
jgi:hemoglobin